MGYRLGVDVGTTFTAAAVDDGSGPRMVGLGNRALQVPSVVFLQADGTFLFGEAAERRGSLEPARVVREFKRRFGDTVPILVAGQPFSPQALTARLLSFVIGAVTEREGSAPDEVVLTHPANWGGFKRELMDQVIRLANVSSALTCTEPEAAAIQYASRADLAEDAKVAVYDLGGGTFDICVLAKQPTGFRILGAPEGVEHLGGIDFDEAVFQHVLRGLGEQLRSARPRRPAGHHRLDPAAPRLRRGEGGAVQRRGHRHPRHPPRAQHHRPAHPHRAGVPDHSGPARHPGRHPPRPSVGADHPRPARRDRPGGRQLPHPPGQPPAPERVRRTHRLEHPPQTRHRPRRRPVPPVHSDPAREPAAPLPAAPPGPAVAHWPTRDAATETPPTPADPAPKPSEDTIPTPISPPTPVRSARHPVAPPPEPPPVPDRPTRPDRGPAAFPGRAGQC